MFLHSALRIRFLFYLVSWKDRSETYGIFWGKVARIGSFNSSLSSLLMNLTLDAIYLFNIGLHQSIINSLSFLFPITFAFFFQLNLHKLSADQLLVNTISFDKIIMSTSLLNLPLLNDNNLICIFNCWQSMRNHHYRLLACFDQLVKCLLDLVFTLSIKSRCCFIKEKDFRFPYKSPCDCYSLFLSSR